MARPQPAITEAELVEGLRAHSPAAFREAVTRYAGAMLATARAIVGAAQAEDVVQDAWLTVFRRIDGFEGRSSLGTWLQRIVANRAVSLLRRSGREINASDGPGDEIPADWFDAAGGWSKDATPPAWHTSSPDALLTADELQECLDKHLDAMPDAQRVVLVMRDMEGCEFDDICGALDVTTANVRVLLHRARLRLVKMVNHFEETGSC